MSLYTESKRRRRYVHSRVVLLLTSDFVVEYSFEYSNLTSTRQLRKLFNASENLTLLTPENSV